MTISSALFGIGSVLYTKTFVTLPIPSKDSELSKQAFTVTGANGGLGYEACLHLSRLGAGKLIMAVQTLSKGEEAKKNILSSTGQSESSIEVWSLDMDSYESIKSFTARISELPRIDGVLANAGIMTTQYSLSEGVEKTLYINVISTFLLYLLLLPKMRESGQKTGHTCTFVIPNSALHYMAPFGELNTDNKSIMDRLNDFKTADMDGRYPFSKLLVLYATREFADGSRGSNM